MTRIERFATGRPPRRGGDGHGERQRVITAHGEQVCKQAAVQFCEVHAAA
ncbi:hypothetical protein [Streptomyces sp. BE133]|nr:hypothetical protein [Streptomyces sp. BE133]MEE1813317.1 hypothetical protein [Streptomyces sp. BE133]